MAQWISTFADIVKPYSAFESWGYDLVVGPVLCRYFEAYRDEIATDLQVGGRALDVGCGGGHVAMAMAEWRPDIEMTGLDLSAEQVARARRRAARFGARVQFVEGTVLSLPFADESFDLVVSIGSLKHWPDRSAGIAECMRVLRRGGRFFITETDRSAHHHSVQRFVRDLGIPTPLRPLALMAFRTYVAGQSLDLLEARDLVSNLTCVRATVARALENGGLILSGTRIA